MGLLILIPNLKKVPMGTSVISSYLWFFPTLTSSSHCLKMTPNVSFNIASEASKVYILSGPKFIKNAQKRPIWRLFWKSVVCGQTVLPDRSSLKGQKLVENAKVESLQKMIILGIFNQLLSTKNVNVARLAHNVEGDFFCDFQTPWLRHHQIPI